MSLSGSIKIPEWVNWVAQDEDGAWWGYSVEPLQQHSGWYENEVGKTILLMKDPPNPDWGKTLSKISSYDNSANDPSEPGTIIPA